MLLLVGTVSFGSIANGTPAESIPVKKSADFFEITSLAEITPYNLNNKPHRTVDLVDWEKLNAIPNNSIESCSDIDKTSASWQFMNTHKRPETDILLVATSNELYPCQYMARHLQTHRFGMASLEDIPLAVSQKFASKYPIFFRQAKFYKKSFHDPDKALNYLKHEETHIIQGRYNPWLERYMWNQEKTALTPYGRFIEGCTESHFPTDGPGYEAYVEEYEKFLQKNTKTNVDHACSGNFDTFEKLKR